MKNKWKHLFGSFSCAVPAICLSVKIICQNQRHRKILEAIFLNCLPCSCCCVGGGVKSSASTMKLLCLLTSALSSVKFQTGRWVSSESKQTNWFSIFTFSGLCSVILSLTWLTPPCSEAARFSDLFMFHVQDQRIWEGFFVCLFFVVQLLWKGSWKGQQDMLKTFDFESNLHGLMEDDWGHPYICTILPLLGWRPTCDSSHLYRWPAKTRWVDRDVKECRHKWTFQGQCEVKYSLLYCLLMTSCVE